jgi:hypothetical protein
VVSVLSLAIVSALAAATERGPLLVVRYQAEGVSATEAAEAQRAIEEAFRARGVSLATDERASKASEMCGEEPACLASLGARAHARWVLAYGIGQVGHRVLTSGVLVDVAEAVIRGRDSKELDREGLGWTHEATTLAERLDPDITAPVSPPAPPPNLTPQTVPPPPPLEIQKPAGNPQLRTYAWVSGGTAAALLAGSGVVGLLALSNYQTIESTDYPSRPPLNSQQRTLNATGDALLIGGVVVAGVAATLFYLSREPSQ